MITGWFYISKENNGYWYNYRPLFEISEGDQHKVFMLVSDWHTFYISSSCLSTSTC